MWKVERLCGIVFGLLSVSSVRRQDLAKSEDSKCGKSPSECYGASVTFGKDFWYVSFGNEILFLIYPWLQEPNDEQIKLLMQLSDSTSDPTLKVKCIGTLECLAQYPTSIPHNQVCLSCFPPITAKFFRL